MRVKIIATNVNVKSVNVSRMIDKIFFAKNK